MDILKVTEEGWEVFRKRYPRANDFLVNESLIGEHNLLQAELAHDRFTDTRRKAWVIERLHQLEKLYGPIPTGCHVMVKGSSWKERTEWGTVSYYNSAEKTYTVNMFSKKRFVDADVIKIIRAPEELVQLPMNFDPRTLDRL